LRGRGDIKAGSLAVERLRFSGSLDIGGNCEAEELELSGVLQVKGLLSAEKVRLKLYGPSSAAEVGGGTITVKRSKTKALLQPGQHSEMRFTSGLIEGDYVELENTHAETVRGDKVIIGAGCVIQKVEYGSFLEIHKGAIVKQQVKIAK
jgi:cytoskeletal protein CcmA (bactofilin family)